MNIKIVALLGLFVFTSFVCAGDENPQHDPVVQRIYWRGLAAGVAAVGASLYVFRADHGIYPHVIAFPVGMLAYFTWHRYASDGRREQLETRLEEMRQNDPQTLTYSQQPMGASMPPARRQQIQVFYEQQRAGVRQVESRSA